MVRRREVDDEGDEADAEAEAVAHTSTYSSAGKKSARTDLESELELDWDDGAAADTALWYLAKLPHAIVYVCHARMVRNDDDDERDA